MEKLENTRKTRRRKLSWTKNNRRPDTCPCGYSVGPDGDFLLFGFRPDSWYFENRISFN